MTTRGVYGTVIEAGRELGPCLIIGRSVPRIHHSDGVPVYLVLEHERGMPVRCTDGRERSLLAYPSDWPAPGEHDSDRFVYAKHERLGFNAPVPLFDQERAQ